MAKIRSISIAIKGSYKNTANFAAGRICALKMLHSNFKTVT